LQSIENWIEGLDRWILQSILLILGSNIHP
jgi:hypothetical protein